MTKIVPTHHILFDDTISSIAQGWRYVILSKVGSKWTYFQLCDGTGHTYKVNNKKWESMTKREILVDGSKGPITKT